MEKITRRCDMFVRVPGFREPQGYNWRCVYSARERRKRKRQSVLCWRWLLLMVKQMSVFSVVIVIEHPRASGEVRNKWN